MSKTETVVENKKQKHKKANLCDVLGQHAKYVVFTKDDKLQVIRDPKDKAIGKKIKNKWHFDGWVKTDESETALLKILAKVYKTKEELQVREVNARI